MQRPDHSPVANSALSCSRVSVGMQRDSSLRTQRVAGSCAESEAHKKEHDWQFKESHFPQSLDPEKGGGIYGWTDNPRGEAGQGASAANRLRALGGRCARRSATWRQCNVIYSCSMLLQYSEKTVHRGTDMRDYNRDTGEKGWSGKRLFITYLT